MKRCLLVILIISLLACGCKGGGIDFRDGVWFGISRWVQNELAIKEYNDTLPQRLEAERQRQEILWIAVVLIVALAVVFGSVGAWYTRHYLLRRANRIYPGPKGRLPFLAWTTRDGRSRITADPNRMLSAVTVYTEVERDGGWEWEVQHVLQEDIMALIERTTARAQVIDGVLVELAHDRQRKRHEGFRRRIKEEAGLFFPPELLRIGPPEER